MQIWKTDKILGLCIHSHLLSYYATGNMVFYWLTQHFNLISVLIVFTDQMLQTNNDDLHITLETTFVNLHGSVPRVVGTAEKKYLKNYI